MHFANLVTPVGESNRELALWTSGSACAAGLPRSGDCKEHLVTKHRHGRGRLQCSVEAHMEREKEGQEEGGEERESMQVSDYSS